MALRNKPSTISLRLAVVEAVGLNEAYVLARIEAMTEFRPVIHDNGRAWISMPLKAIAADLLPLGKVTAYKCISSLVGAGILDSCRGASLGLRVGHGHLQMHYSIDMEQLQVLEDAYAFSPV